MTETTPSFAAVAMAEVDRLADEKATMEEEIERLRRDLEYARDALQEIGDEDVVHNDVTLGFLLGFTLAERARIVAFIRAVRNDYRRDGHEPQVEALDYVTLMIERGEHAE